MTPFERRMWRWAWSVRSRLDLKRAMPGERRPSAQPGTDRDGSALRWAPYSSAYSEPGTSDDSPTSSVVSR